MSEIIDELYEEIYAEDDEEYAWAEIDDNSPHSECRFGCGREAVDEFGACDSLQCMIQMAAHYPEAYLGRI